MIFFITKYLKLYINFINLFKYTIIKNKAGYTATKVACGRAGAIFEVTRPFEQEQRSPKIKIIKMETSP